MTEAEKHANRVLNQAADYVSKQWGRGWPRLSVDLQQALVRAEILAEIGRISTVKCDPIAYQEMVDAMATKTMQWWPE